MARTSFQNAIADLYALLAADDAGNPETALVNAGCKKVYPHEPGATGVASPCSITITPAGIEPTDWRIAVRVYVKDTTPAVAQDLLIDVTVAASTLLASGQGYGPDRWEFGWIDEIGAHVAVSEVMVGREDGF